MGTGGRCPRPRNSHLLCFRRTHRFRQLPAPEKEAIRIETKFYAVTEACRRCLPHPPGSSLPVYGLPEEEREKRYAGLTIDGCQLLDATRRFLGKIYWNTEEYLLEKQKGCVDSSFCSPFMEKNLGPHKEAETNEIVKGITPAAYRTVEIEIKQPTIGNQGFVVPVNASLGKLTA